MKLRQRQLSAPKPISAAALRQRLYARPGLFAPAARLTRDDVGQNFRPRIHSRATSLPLFLSICYASLPPPPISRYLCSASIALLRSPLLSSSSSPLLPSRKTVRLTKPGSRKLRGDNVGTTFLRVSSARGGKKTHLVFLSRTPVAWANKLSSPPPSLSFSLSRSFPNKDRSLLEWNIGKRSGKIVEDRDIGWRNRYVAKVAFIVRRVYPLQIPSEGGTVRLLATNPCQDNSELLGPRGVQDFDLYRNAKRGGAALNGLITPRPPSALRLPLLHKLPRQQGRSRKN